MAKEEHELTLHLRATHPDCAPVERVIDACPALVGRDEKLCACTLPADDRVSKIHASLDVRDGRVLVRDAKSTNGTFVRGQALEPNRWTDVGGLDEDVALRIADWEVHLRARRVTVPTTTRGPFSAPGGATVVDATPFGASQSPTAVATPGAAGFLVSFAGPVDRISEPARAASAALQVLRSAIVAELSNVPPQSRAALVQRLREQYAEVRNDLELDAHVARLVPEHVQTATPAAGAAAYAALQDLSRWYVDGNQAVSTPEDIALFKERLRLGIDELVSGIVSLVGGVDHYNDRMEVDAAGAPYPRNAQEFARTVFEWRDETRDGAQVVRAAVLDVIVQQLGSFQATVRGVRELLAKLDPARIEGEWKKEAEKQGRWGGLVARLLGPVRIVRAYRQQHHNLASEEDGWFHVLFGKRFAEEYQAFARETRASDADKRPSTLPRAEPRPTPQLASPPRAPAAPLPVAPSPAPPPATGGIIAMAPALKPSAPPAGRGGTVAIAPALKPRGAPAGSEPDQ